MLVCQADQGPVQAVTRAAPLSRVTALRTVSGLLGPSPATTGQTQGRRWRQVQNPAVRDERQHWRRPT